MNEDNSKQKFEDLLKQSGITEYSFTEAKFAAYDAEFTGEKGKYLVEIKERQDAYIKYSDMFLERKKYEKLMQLKEEGGYHEVLYVHTYPSSNEIRVASLSKLNINWANETHQKTSFNKGVKISKDVAYITDYKVFTLNN